MKGLLAFFFTLMFFNVNSQVDFIQGGGTLDDWANLAKYRSANSEIINNPIDNLVVFMGNSITITINQFINVFSTANFEITLNGQSNSPRTIDNILVESLAD